jgi:hypothetical protein
MKLMQSLSRLPSGHPFAHKQQGYIAMTERTAFIEKMELQLDKLNKKMIDLEATAQEAKEEARQKFKDDMSKLRHQSKVAVAKLDELKAASVDSWKNMVTDMETMYDAFTHSFFSLFQTPSPGAHTTATEKIRSPSLHKKE